MGNRTTCALTIVVIRLYSRHLGSMCAAPGCSACRYAIRTNVSQREKARECQRGAERMPTCGRAERAADETARECWSADKRTNAAPLPLHKGLAVCPGGPRCSHMPNQCQAGRGRRAGVVPRSSEDSEGKSRGSVAEVSMPLFRSPLEACLSPLPPPPSRSLALSLSRSLYLPPAPSAAAALRRISDRSPSALASLPQRLATLGMAPPIPQRSSSHTKPSQVKSRA